MTTGLRTRHGVIAEIILNSRYGRSLEDANAFAEDKARCLAAGMTDALIKPFNPDQLFSALIKHLDRRSESQHDVQSRIDEG